MILTQWCVAHVRQTSPLVSMWSASLVNCWTFWCLLADCMSVTFPVNCQPFCHSNIKTDKNLDFKITYIERSLLSPGGLEGFNQNWHFKNKVIASMGLMSWKCDRYNELVFHDLLPSFRILGRVREMLRVPNMLAGTSLADSPDDTEVIVERHSRHVVTIILLPGAWGNGDCTRHWQGCANSWHPYCNCHHNRLAGHICETNIPYAGRVWYFEVIFPFASFHIGLLKTVK